MIEGHVDERGLSVIEVPFAGRTWTATIDTGFNGYVELPDELRYAISPRYLGRSPTLLASGHVVTEDQYAVQFPFDGELRRVAATFAPGNEILLGTALIGSYRFTIDFPDRRVWLERE